MQPKSTRVNLSNEAQADAHAAVDRCIGEGALIAVDDFSDEVNQALDHLSRFPELGRISARSTRALALHSFPYSLIYRLHVDVIRIIAVVHHSRRLGYWAGRR
ncbi:MAG: type II toxin-antitoxin system RelE/ParE family toxin [Lysobacterales bacterium]